MKIGRKANLKKENRMHRMVHLGVGDLSQSKYSDLQEIRQKSLNVSNYLIQNVFVQEPLKGVPTNKEILNQLTTLEKQDFQLNSAYVQKMRENVYQDVTKIHEQYFHKLYGRLKSCDKKIEYSKKTVAKAQKQRTILRKYINVPEDIQSLITKEELSDLKQFAESGKTNSLFKSVIVDGETWSLTDNQLKVVKEIHRLVQERYKCPEYGKDENWICQIHLDSRVIKGNADKLTESISDINQARILLDENNRVYKSFLEITKAVPRSGTVRIPIKLKADVLKKLDKDKDKRDITSFTSFCIEIGRRKVEVKGAFSRPDDEKATLVELLNSCTNFLARDFGYKNTITLTLMRRDSVITQDQLDDIKKIIKVGERNVEKAKAMSREYLENHVHPGDNIIQRWRFSGQKFLDRINEQSRKIDAYRSDIDCVYDRINRIKILLNQHLGQKNDEDIAEGLEIADPEFRRKYNKFFKLLKRVDRLKAKRREIYDSISGLKKSWFGFLSNVEVQIAEVHDAALVHEHLTIMANEKESPGYKGRAFNRMTNNGSKGKYLRQSEDKLDWNGVPTISVPSFHTSTTSYKYGLVDGSQRNGDVFKCGVSGVVEHSDEHGADTIGLYLLMRRKVPDTIGLNL